MPAGILLVAFVAGCAPGAPPATVASGADPCLIDSDSRDTLDLFVADLPSAQHAPVPRNDSERLVFRQLYATLLRIDCTGAVRAGLAERWLPSFVYKRR